MLQDFLVHYLHNLSQSIKENTNRKNSSLGALIIYGLKKIYSIGAQ